MRSISSIHSIITSIYSAHLLCTSVACDTLNWSNIKILFSFVCAHQRSDFRRLQPSFFLDLIHLFTIKSFIYHWLAMWPRPFFPKQPNRTQAEYLQKDHTTNIISCVLSQSLNSWWFAVVVWMLCFYFAKWINRFSQLVIESIEWLTAYNVHSHVILYKWCSQFWTRCK